MNKLFIVGCSRSGTTVLQQALNRHSQIVIPPETKFFYYFYGKSKARQLAHLRRINLDLQIDMPIPDRAIRGPHEARASYDRMAQLYLKRLGREDVAWFGEKTPEHTGHLRSMKQVFPEAKVVFLFRDGRDVALSLSRMPWVHCDAYVGFLIWLYYYRILKEQQERPSFDICFVRYEDLVSEPAEELDRVLRFLDLPFESAVAEGWGNTEGIPRREYAWKSRAMEKISTDRIGIWRRELSAVQVAGLERLGRHALTGLGYELSDTLARPLPPWFFVTLGWGLLRCAARLPLCCLANELAGAVTRYFGPKSLDKQRTCHPKSIEWRVDGDSKWPTSNRAFSDIANTR